MNITEWRDANQESQASFAKRAELAQAYISQIENGIRRPSPAAALRIEQATNGEVSASSLLGLEKTRGMSEDASSFHSASEERASVSIHISKYLKESAAELDIDAAEFLSKGGQPALEAEVRRVFREKHKDAIQWSASYVDENGTLSEQFGMI